MSEYTLPTSIDALQKQIETTFIELVKELGIKNVPAKILQPAKTAGFSSSLICYPLAKDLKKKPEEVAVLVIEELKKKGNPLFSRYEQDKAFVNFAISPHVLAAATLGEHMVPRTTKTDDRDPVVIEFSSPNTNKPQHLGHVRNNCLGDALAKMVKHTGQKVITINLINDRGIHICKSMLAYQKFGNGTTPESTSTKGDHFVGDYYVRFEKELEKEYAAWLETPESETEFAKWTASETGRKALAANERERKKIQTIKDDAERESKLAAIPTDKKLYKSEYKQYFTNNFSALGREANEMLVKWEANDPAVRDLWQKMNSWVFNGFKETYQMFGIEHEVVQKESEMYEKGKAIVMEALEKGDLEKLENGSIACDLVKIGVLKKGTGEKETKKVLLRANGTTLYMTQDLGVAVTRQRLYCPQKFIYVVANEQDRHFAILFKLAESLLPKSKGKWHHLSYGMVNLPTGRMKSREGTVVDADDLAKGLTDMAREITKDKWPDISDDDLNHRASKIAMAALKFYILSFNPPTTISFDPKQSLAFSGKAGPYLLYQYARTRSILAKANIKPEELKYDQSTLAKLGTEGELALLKSIFELNKDIQFAIDTYDPSKVADSIYEIAKNLNGFYKLKTEHPVVNCTDSDLKNARLQLVYVSGEAIKLGLKLLGIETVEKM